VFFSLCFALRERQGRTEAVEAKMQEERKLQPAFLSCKTTKMVAKDKNIKI
jgi:hypothetical protein